MSPLRDTVGFINGKECYPVIFCKLLKRSYESVKIEKKDNQKDFVVQTLLLVPNKSTAK